MGYEREQKLFGSSYEPILQKVDSFLPFPLGEALKKREGRASLLVEADGLAKEAVERVKEIGIDHPFIHKEIVSFCNPVKKLRMVEMGFEEAFAELKENLKGIIERPEQMRVKG